MALLLALSAGPVSSAATSSSATPSSSEAVLTVTPAQGAAGLLVSLAGSGLPAHRRAGLFLGRRRLARFRTDRRGDWTARTRLPVGGAIGTSSLRVVIARHQMIATSYPVTALVAPGSAATSLAALSSGEHVRLSPTRAPAGSFVSLQGAGFKHHAVAGVWLDGTRLLTLRASPGGALREFVRIPFSTRPRGHILSIRFGRRRLSLDLAVTPAALLALGAAPPASPAPPASGGGGGGGGGAGSPNAVVDAVGDMGCASTDPNYNNGNGNPNAVPPANYCLQKAVSNLIASPLPTALLDLGDNQYNNGELANYQAVYDPTFGRANSVVYPSLGNAEYNISSSAAGFFGYFGQSTTVFSRIEADGGDNTNLTTGGYYSFNLGTHWHIIALNSNCVDLSGGCGAGGPEETWLKADLNAHSGMCTLAYWHHPRWNSGSLGNDPSTAAFWSDLYAAHADIVLNGHGNHHYERFTPVQAAPDQSGNPIPAADGIREFIVSTGGQSHGTPPTTQGDTATSQRTNYTTFGMLQLTLHPSSYDWHFVPAAGGTFTDSGSANCHA